MRSYLISGAAALALCVALPAAAQSTAASPSRSAPPANSTATPPASTSVNPSSSTVTMPPASTAPGSTSTGSTSTGSTSTGSMSTGATSGGMPNSSGGQPATGASTDASASVPIPTSGLSVKDNTGATIGQITQVKPDGSGKQTATIKMGLDSFAVDTAALVVQNGSAVINSTQAELQGMIKKASPPAAATTSQATTGTTKKKK